MFREDSVTSKFLACASIGKEHKEFLHNVLSGTISAALELKQPLEVRSIFFFFSKQLIYFLFLYQIVESIENRARNVYCRTKYKTIEKLSE